MKPTIDNLQGTFKLSWDSFRESREKSELIHNMFHGKQYDQCTLDELEEAGRPAEIFNIIRLFTRQLMGYYSTVYNTVEVKPVQYEDIVTADLLNDVIRHVDRKNYVINVNESLRLDCILSGLMVHETKAVPRTDNNGKVATDDYGRTIYDIVKKPVPSREILLDPMSVDEDSADARYIHRYRWMTKEDAEEMFSKRKIDTLDAFSTNIAGEVVGESVPFQNQFGDYENYLVVHTIMKDKNKRWSIYWSGDKILSKKKINQDLTNFPYQVVKLQDVYGPEYYGIFEDVYQSQNAINQALLQIQLLTNSNKVIVRTGAIKEEDWEGFKKAIIRVNAVLEIDNPEDITILNMNGEIVQQYTIIDRAFDRIQKVLGINDSFLGMAYASDSGRKVKLQQGATLMALRYLDVKFDLMYKLIGHDTINLIKQYYTANQILRIADESVGEKWVEINRPIQDPRNGQPIFDQVVDPETGELAKDKYGNYLLVPLNEPETDISFTDVDLELVSVAYNDQDEKSQLMLETMINGPLGQALMATNPRGYIQAGGLIIKGLKSRYSDDLRRIFEETAQMMAPQQPNTVPEPQRGQAQAPKSAQLKLPQNTNEGY